MRKDNRESFIEKAKQVHDGKYDYSKVEYVNSQTKVCIICPEHGEFWQTPANHLFGEGCKKCSIIKVHNEQKDNKEEFIEKAKQVHGDKYDYSKCEYKTTEKKVTIICKTHGEFKQTPHSHLQGQGCPVCKQRVLEKEVNNFLTDNKITFEFQKRFDWLGLQSLDFFLPEYNIGIECQGIQHFEEILFFGGKEKFKKQVENDEKKLNLCTEHGIKILYYTKNNSNFVTNLDDLKRKIYENNNQ